MPIVATSTNQAILRFEVYWVYILRFFPKGHNRHSFAFANKQTHKMDLKTLAL